jgi:hypothetical protein
MAGNQMEQSAYRPMTPLAAKSFFAHLGENLKKQGVSMKNDSRVSGAREDEVTGKIESQTSQIPSAAYLGAALGSMAVAAILKMAGKHQGALFVGQWAAPFLLMGVYNKMVKQHGSDTESRQTAAKAA